MLKLILYVLVLILSMLGQHTTTTVEPPANGLQIEFEQVESYDGSESEIPLDDALPEDEPHSVESSSPVDITLSAHEGEPDEDF